VSALVAVLLVVALSLMARTSAAESAPQPRAATTSAAPAGTPATPIPVYAYFYQWFTASSWDRAKVDFPLAGRYSSDDVTVLRSQVRQAQAAGIDGFITSWKNNAPLNRRLDLLVQVAHDTNLDLGVVYQALDFNRNPLPIATVRADMVLLVNRWGAQLKSRYYGRPVIIWTGTDKFSVADIRSVRLALGDRALLLASAKTVQGYERIADLVDGEAYYWSSADPTSAQTSAKLHSFADAVHTHQGLWFAPAAPGYDGTTLGGTRVIDRADGTTLQHSLDNAFAASPDAVAVISWNEWSENTYIEPSERQGDRELKVLQQYLSARSPGAQGATAEPDSSEGAASGGWTGRQATEVLAVLCVAAVVLLPLIRRRPRPDKGTGEGSRAMSHSTP
jgi:hypothetical protein